MFVQWVQCDKCEAWQHQICALFNGRRNDGGQAEYTCPNCYIAEVERGERKPLPQSAVLGAKDLPRTILSDHIEQRLFRKLKQERQDRAKMHGKSFDDVSYISFCGLCSSGWFLKSRVYFYSANIWTGNDENMLAMQVIWKGVLLLYSICLWNWHVLEFVKIFIWVPML
jgi:hypothetical protein